MDGDDTHEIFDTLISMKMLKKSWGLNQNMQNGGIFNLKSFSWIFWTKNRVFRIESNTATELRKVINSNLTK